MARDRITTSLFCLGLASCGGLISTKETGQRQADGKTLTETSGPTSSGDAKQVDAKVQTVADATVVTGTGTDTAVKVQDPVALALTLAWNGDDKAGGNGWATPNTNPVTVEMDGKSGKAVHWKVVPQMNYWNEWGFNWKGWQLPGTPIADAKNFHMSIRLTGNTPPADMTISIRSTTGKYANQPPKDGGLRGVSLKKYEANFADGKWHDVVIPVADFLVNENKDDFKEVYEVFMGAGSSDYELALDDIGFDK